MSDQLRFTLLTASDAVTDAIAAGLLRDDDHPWHSAAGCHPAEGAMDDAKPMDPEFYRGWIMRMAEALRLCAAGRGPAMSVEYARKHKLPGAGVAHIVESSASYHSDDAQRAALDARGSARMAGLDEAEQEAAAQAAFDRVAGPEAGW